MRQVRAPQRVFVDTNCFLHLRDLKDLPWREVLPDVDVLEIVVAPVVVDELDRLKTEKGGRTRNRCRAALDLIERASREEGMRLELRAGPFRIWMVIAEAHRVDWAAFPRLDQTRPDDHLIAAALSEPGEPSILISFDTGPLIRARTVQLPAIRSPESWALPPQQDEAEQKLARLERELAAAKSTRPAIAVQFLDLSDAGTLRLTIPELEPVPSAKQARMLDAVRQRFPRQPVKATDDGPFGIRLGIGGISSSEVDKYNRDYDDFIATARRQFADLHALMAKALCFGEVRFELFNDSAVTAANVRVSMSCSDNFRMFGARSDMELYGGALKRLKRPDTPNEYPSYGLVSHTLQSLREPRRDPMGFYWLDRPVCGDVATLVCDEFRATQRREEVYYIVGSEPREGDVSVEVSATNLTSPVKLSAPVVIERSVGSWVDPAVIRRLPNWISEILADAE